MRTIVPYRTGPIFTKFSGLVEWRMKMIYLIFVLRSLKGRCYGNQFKWMWSRGHTLGFATRFLVVYATTRGSSACRCGLWTTPCRGLALLLSRRPTSKSFLVSSWTRGGLGGLDCWGSRRSRTSRCRARGRCFWRRVAVLERRQSLQPLLHSQTRPPSALTTKYAK